MPKIESIRPGDTLDATFGAYPLAELLLGILRGNLTGRLDVFLHPEPRNHLFFRDGVPVVVSLQDGGGSAVGLLIQDGSLNEDEGLNIVRAAEASGKAELEVLRERALIAQAKLYRFEIRWARAKLVKLFDIGPVDFRFTEGVTADPDRMTILQPLPIVYEGLLNARDRSVVQRFVQVHRDSRFSLSATYPRGVDPFEWGAKVEAAVECLNRPGGITDLEQAGLSNDQACAVLAALHLSDMIDLREQGRKRTKAKTSGRTISTPPSGTPMPARASAPPSPSQPEVEAVRDASGLVIHRRTAPDPVATRPPPTPRPAPVGDERAVGGNAHDREYVAVRERVTPYYGQNYFQILRVTPDTNADQLERAYRFLVRRFEEEMERPGTGPVLDLIHEAYQVLKDPESARRYGQLVSRSDGRPSIERERRAFEAEPKVDRAVRAMGAGRTGEATLLLSWAERLDTSRSDVSAYFGVLDLIRAPDGQRAADAHSLRTVLQEQVAQRAYDWRIKMCLGLVLAEDGEPEAAARLLEKAPDRAHPMMKRVAAIVDEE